MKIAITSQNRKTITQHAGRCRKFYVFNIENSQILSKELLERPKAQSFRDSPSEAPHPLDDVNALIAGGMGEGLMRRLSQKGIKCLVTTEDDPERAVSLYLGGVLPSE